MIRTPFIEASHPEHQAEQEEAHESLKVQLREVAANLESYRRTLRPVPSENAWVREWPALGSQKTWSKILRTEMDGINIAAKLADYRGVLHAVNAQSRKRAAEELYDDLGGAQEVTLATLRLMHHHGKDRLILIEGGSGSGKTSSLDLLSVSAASGSAIYRLDANEAWKSQRVAMRAILRALGLSDAKIPTVTGEMMETLISTIRTKGRIVIAIDEAHHVSGCVLNLFKSLLNETEMLLILAGMSTLFEKLRTAASEEAKQLIHNRLFCRVKLGGPNKEGARDFLSRRLGADSGWKEATITILVETARHCGHWSFLRRVVDQLANNGTNDPTDNQLLDAGRAAAKEIA